MIWSTALSLVIGLAAFLTLILTSDPAQILALLLQTGWGLLLVAALQIAGPLVAVLFLTDVGLGLLTRAAPALNAFALGFPLKILITLALGSVAIAVLPPVVASLAEDGARQVVRVGEASADRASDSAPTEPGR